MTVTVYAVGLVHLSVCSDLPPNATIDSVNASHPTGLDWGWHFDEAPTFSDGSPNPCPCDVNPAMTHYLLSC